MSQPKAEPKSLPFVGMAALVRMREAINGQLEHAAIVTQINHETLTVNAMIFPAAGLPYPVSGIPQAGDSRPLPHWRFLPKT